MKMKSFLYIIVVGVMMMGLTACHADEDQLFTTAAITLTGSDTIYVDRIQGTITLTNLNTKERVTTADFDGCTATVNLLRGVYQVSVDGQVKYRDGRGITHIDNFRASQDQVSIVGSSMTIVELPMILMNP
ncbi:hypothetical protein [Segatella albensis]|jgi:hypothetical protein|uniref:hypothetical protein n=1 Tax=Segatella albensis TaxID=77768 RepID=UPI0004164C74|nr:hypothetical protein [Segatella albensis]